MPVDAESFLDRIERRAPLREHGPPVRDTLIVDERGEIIPDRRLELRLLLLQLENALVRGKPAHLRVECAGGNSFRGSLRLHARDAGAEILLGVGRSRHA